MYNKITKKDSIIIIDIGKTNIKICIFEYVTDKLLSKKIYKNTLIYDDEHTNININNIFEIIYNSIQHNIEVYNVLSILPITHGSVLISLDKNDQILTHISDENRYLDNIDYEYNILANNIPNTFTPILPYGYNIAKQLYYLKYYYKEKYKYIKTILLYPQYISWLLTGIKSSEITYLGNHSHLWDYKINTFSEFANQLHLNRYLPKSISATISLGKLNINKSKYKYLKAPVDVYPGSHDSMVCYHYHKYFNKSNFTLISTGTWILAFNECAEISNVDLNKDMLINLDIFGNHIPTARYPGGIEYSLLTENYVEPKYFDYEYVDYILMNNDFILPAFHESGPFIGNKGKLIIKTDHIANNDYMWHLINLYLALNVNYMLTLLNTKSKVIIDGVFRNNAYFKFYLTNLINNILYFNSSDDGVVSGGYIICKPDNNVKYKALEVPKCKRRIFKLKQYENKWHKLINNH